MQTLNQKKQKSRKINIKKSQILLFGSLLVFMGICLIGYNTFIALREEVYSDLKLDIVTDTVTSQSIDDVPVAENISNEEYSEIQEYVEPVQQQVNYDNYLGVLEIPRISLKRGFYGLDNRYNNIQYNVTLVNGSTMPDVPNGNLILMAHSGDAYISFFAYLFRLNIGDNAYVTYKGVKYTYKIVNIYNVPKTGQVTIKRNYDRTTMTLITCTKDNDQSQTIYILEQV